MSIFLTFSHHSRKTGALRAICCLLAVLAVGIALSAAERVFAQSALQHELWQCFSKAAQGAAALCAARAVKLTLTDCGLCAPKRIGAPIILAFAAAALAFWLLAPVQGGTGIASVSFAEACLIAPLAEELIFRGAVQGALEEYGAAAVPMQAVVFALMHGSPPQNLYALALGALLGLLRRRTGSILGGCVLHTLYNIIVFMI